MMPGETKRRRKFQNQSLMTLASAYQPQSTKKSIETDEIWNVSPIPMNNKRKFVFALPFSTEMSVLVSVLTTKFVVSIVHAQHDSNSALLVLEGIKIEGMKQKLGRLLDYFIFCCSRGAQYGGLWESYNVVVITIKREVVQNRCLITVSNPYPHQCFLQFTNHILNPIQQQLKTLGKKQGATQNEISRVKSMSLSHDSPCQKEMHVHRKIYHLLIHTEHKQLDKYKDYLQNSLKMIQEVREDHLKKVDECRDNKRLPDPSKIVVALITESQKLIKCLEDNFRQEQYSSSSFLYSFMVCQNMHKVALYKIQQVLCLYELPMLKQVYLRHYDEQCAAFNSNMLTVNDEFTDEDCFQCLVLKQKYRLPSEKRPYHSTIDKLKSLEFCLSLREMLLVIQECYSLAKTDCLAAWQGKVELNSMDDLQPVIIFVTVRAAISNFPALVQLIDDYIRIKDKFENEERVIVTFQAAALFISRKWQRRERAMNLESQS